MISLVVPYLEIDDEKPALLKRFLDSVEGQYDELVIIDSKTNSYTKKVNDGLKKTIGDHIVVATDDIYVTSGNIRNLAKDWVTYPVVNGEPVTFGAIFCLPRAVYEQIGGLDEAFSIYFSDDDYLRRLAQANIQCLPVMDVHVHHPEGGRTVKKITGINNITEQDKAVFKAKWGSNYNI